MGISYSTNPTPPSIEQVTELKAGDYLKTYSEGNKKIKHIFIQQVINTKCNHKCNPHKHLNKCFTMKQTPENGLTHDLILVGGHSVLVDTMSDKNKTLMEKNGMKYLQVHDKYKEFVAIRDDFVQVTDGKKEIVYLIVMENDDTNKCYGLYANGGFLIESCREQACINSKLIPI